MTTTVHTTRFGAMEIPIPDLVALDRAVGVGQLGDLLLWAAATERFPIVDLEFHNTGDDDSELRVIMMTDADGPENVVRLTAVDDGDLDDDACDTLEHYMSGDAASGLEARWTMRGRDIMTDLGGPWAYLLRRALGTRQKLSMKLWEHQASRSILVVELGVSEFLGLPDGHEYLSGQEAYCITAAGSSGLIEWHAVALDDGRWCVVRKKTHPKVGGAEAPEIWLARSSVEDVPRMLKQDESADDIDSLLGYRTSGQ